MKKLIIFDLDGVICSTDHYHYLAWKALADRLGIPFWRTDHAPATTMEVCHDIDAVLDVLICKNLFLCNRQKTNFYLLMMPGDKPFKTKDLSGQLGVARLSFADEAHMEEMLDLLRAKWPQSKLLLTLGSKGCIYDDGQRRH